MSNFAGNSLERIQIIGFDKLNDQMKRVVVGLSGGVDSSVAAYLLKEQGYEVIGIFMRNWHDESVTISNDCPWVEDSNDAMAVAEKLDIPFQVIDFSEKYKERIVDYMFKEYQEGRTPNPDILCNREIKFDVFLETAMQLKADFVATGHYCRKETTMVDGEEVHHLLAGVDNNKDQSYFLCQLNQNQLSKALFPVGHLQKPEVRAIAAELDLVTAEKKDSQGLCFIGKVKLPDFLQQQLKPKEGKVIEITKGSELFNHVPLRLPENLDQHLDMLTAEFNLSANAGESIGVHTGAHYFTIGQRKGLSIGGKPEPLFVLGTDTVENIVYTGQGTNHPGLYRWGLKIKNEDIHWIQPALKLKDGETISYKARIRYRQELEAVQLFQKNDYLYLIFDNMQRGIAKGQFAAWYLNDELVGSGVID